MSNEFLNGLQAASNAVAGNVAGPVDILAFLLRKAGMPVPENAIGGSNWMTQKGLMAPVRQGASQVIGETAGLLGPAMVSQFGPQIARGLLKGGENLAAPRTLNSQTGAVVYHGSPHKFDKFDSSKIGTGEGAQAYGHGLYLADAPDVAGQYATMNAKSAPKPQTLQRLRDAAPKGSAEWKHYDALLNEGTSNLYKVDLPDEKIARMLDWDAPLSQQPEMLSTARAAMHKGPQESLRMDVWVRDNPNATGGDLIKQIERLYGIRYANEALGKAGIPGIRYLDGGSRGAGQGTRNYVVFPGEESSLRILERNGQGLLDEPVKPALLNQGKRGQRGAIDFGMPNGARRMEIAQRNAAKPVSEGGLGLGPNNTAQERAKALGFDTEMFHGQTGMSLSERGPLTHIARDIGKAEEGALFGAGPNLASRYAKDRDWIGQGGAVYPLQVRSSELVKSGYPMPSNAELEKMSPKQIEKLIDDIDAWNNKVDKVGIFQKGIGTARATGKDGAVFTQMVDAPSWTDARSEIPQDIYGMLSGVRSRFAAFDPARRNEADLLGGADPYLLALLGLGAGGAAWYGQD